MSASPLTDAPAWIFTSSSSICTRKTSSGALGLPGGPLASVVDEPAASPPAALAAACRLHAYYYLYTIVVL
jgi:hypothetical protein